MSFFYLIIKSECTNKKHKMAKEKAKTELYFQKNNKGTIILAFPFLSPKAVDQHHVSLLTAVGL